MAWHMLRSLYTTPATQKGDAAHRNILLSTYLRARTHTHSPFPPKILHLLVLTYIPFKLVHRYQVIPITPMLAGIKHRHTPNVHDFKMHMLGRGFYTSIRNVSFPSPIDVGFHNPPPLAA